MSFRLVVVPLSIGTCSVALVVMMPSYCPTTAIAVGPLRQTAAMITPSAGADAVIADLLTDPIGAGDVRARVPAAPDLYA
jgi:hypothetical protein